MRYIFHHLNFTSTINRLYGPRGHYLHFTSWLGWFSIARRPFLYQKLKTKLHMKCKHRSPMRKERVPLWTLWRNTKHRSPMLLPFPQFLFINKSHPKWELKISTAPKTTLSNVLTTWALGMQHSLIDLNVISWLAGSNYLCRTGKYHLWLTKPNAAHQEPKLVFLSVQDCRHRCGLAPVRPKYVAGVLCSADLVLIEHVFPRSK